MGVQNHDGAPGVRGASSIEYIRTRESTVKGFSKEVFENRRKNVMDHMGRAVAVFPAAREQIRSNDTTFPFRQDNDFYYLTGFPEPDALAVLVGTEPKRFILFTRPRDPKQEIWTGRRYGPEGAREIFGAQEAYPVAQLDVTMPEILSNVDRVLFAFGKEEAWDRRMMGWINQVRAKGRRGAVCAPTELIDAARRVHEMRIFKDRGEIERMRQAANISAEAHMLAMQACSPGMTERDLQNRLEHACMSRGAQAMAYETIVAGGPNACVLHYVENTAPLKEGELVLIDAGCELDHYASDISRTFPVSGRFTEPQRRIYGIVLEAQQTAIDTARQGETIRSVHSAAVHVLAARLVELGLLEGDPERHARICLQRAENSDEEAWEEKLEEGEIGLERYYMHNTSHWLGMDVHDVGRYREAGVWRTLEPGMILTVEPGLYIASDADYAPKAYRGIGIRIEDDVLVTEGEPEILTAPCATSVEAVEAACLG
jgi:Xaa-Pro aminopeptidase